MKQKEKTQLQGAQTQDSYASIQDMLSFQELLFVINTKPHLRLLHGPAKSTLFILSVLEPILFQKMGELCRFFSHSEISIIFHHKPGLLFLVITLVTGIAIHSVAQAKNLSKFQLLLAFLLPSLICITSATFLIPSLSSISAVIT